MSTTKLSEVINQHRGRFLQNAAMALAAAPLVAMASAEESRLTPEGCQTRPLDCHLAGGPAATIVHRNPRKTRCAV